jgi:hypothetical protein
VPTADVLYACDHPWWRFSHAEVVRSGFAGELWTQDEGAAREYGLHHIRAYSRPGLSREPGIIYHGNNSGYQAIGLAYLWGASRVLLLGYDAQHTGGKRHWFGDHRRGLSNATGVTSWPKKFEELAKDSEAVGLEVVNCSTETALRCFPRARLEDVL